MQGEDRLRDLVAIEPLVVLNAGFCERHMRHCPPSEQLRTACAQVPLRRPIIFLQRCVFTRGPVGTKAVGLPPVAVLFFNRCSWCSRGDQSCEIATS